MIDIDKLMKEKLEKVKKGYQSCKKALCESCPYDYSKRPDDHYCDSSEMSDDAIKVIEYLEKKVEDQQERIDIMSADAPRWYPASMKPEKDDEDYYALTKDYGIIPLHFLDGEWGIFAECFVGDACSGEEWVGIEKLKINFSHWMPIPKPPKEGDQQ